MSIGTAILGLGTSLVNSSNQAKIAKQTNASNTAIANNALAQQKDEFGQVSTAAQPELAAGQAGLNNEQGANYTQSPGFQNALHIGTQSVLGSQALNGLLRSGSAVKALTNYATGAADKDYDTYIGQQQTDAGQYGTGLNALSSAAAGTSNAVGANAANLENSNNNMASGLNQSNNNAASGVLSAGTQLMGNTNVNSLFQSFLKSMSPTAGGAAPAPVSSYGTQQTVPA